MKLTIFQVQLVRRCPPCTNSKWKSSCSKYLWQMSSCHISSSIMVYLLHTWVFHFILSLGYNVDLFLSLWYLIQRRKDDNPLWENVCSRWYWTRSYIKLMFLVSEFEIYALADYSRNELVRNFGAAEFYDGAIAMDSMKSTFIDKDCIGIAIKSASR